MSSNTDKSSAPRRTNQAQKQERLAELMDRYRHALADDDERMELRDRIIRMRRRFQAKPGRGG